MTYPTATSTWDAGGWTNLRINGVAVTDFACGIQEINGLYTVANPRGENIVFPGVDGETFVDKPYATAQIELGLVLHGKTIREFNDRLRSLRVLCRPGKRLTLTRRISYSTGTEEHVAIGEYAGGLTPSITFGRTGRVTLTLNLHDGLWYSGTDRSVTVAAGESTHTIVGETRTHRMRIDMQPGATLINRTNGHTLSNSLSSGGTVTVDVEAMTATQAGVDVSAAITWTKRFPMRLDEGSNALSSTHSASIRYRAAYQ